ncbi:MAG: hypothetical protein KC729_02710 [Candidatus Eisenbacteria bacterium]|uniref:Uncharacterized protein n=1 Tax=Eiseniibacteriota bacterium TaxID=2212470 RepID=A0A956LVV3_UNCEI|nr:hypothetical protein [Candidatus Eisenbacteria bacterium]
MSDGGTEPGTSAATIGAAKVVGSSLRDVYAKKGLSQIPRLLSLQDRNPLSRTYGCFNREYWLCRTLDFPSAIAQFGVHSLALAYVTPFPDNPYFRSPKIREWTLAGIDYWMRIQKSDGSFDEFYPNERGWAGPTGFLLYVMCDSYRLLGSEFPESERNRFLEAVARAGRFLAKYDEPGVLANHHAMAVLPIYEAYALLGEKKLLDGFRVRLDDFLAQTRDEGWCLEYDGADLGYLSATVSFLSKLHKLYQDERTETVCRRAIDFAAYFAYPNKHYAGSMGSRQTLHFYPHGFEVYAGQGNGLAAAVAQRLLEGLAEGALVPPEIQEDRYFLYRIPELLQSWVDYGGRPDPLPALPDQGEPFQRYWPGAKIYARKGVDARGRAYYTLVNLAKGGVVKHFRLDTGASVENDCGFLAQLADGKVITSQWISEGNRARGPQEAAESRGSSGGSPAAATVAVESPAHFMVMKLFNPITMIGFRVFMLAVGWQTRLAYEIKGWIRKLLMTRSGASPVRWSREVSFGADEFVIRDRIEKGTAAAFTRLLLGDEFHVRYVPQSRYFQPQELTMQGIDLEPEVLDRLNRTGTVTMSRRIDYYDGLRERRVEE